MKGATLTIKIFRRDGGQISEERADLVLQDLADLIDEYLEGVEGDLIASISGVLGE